MRLESITLRRVPGLPRELEIGGFGPGLNLVIGPNGSGKSSFCRAVHHLLWPQSAPSRTELAARWRGAAGESLRVELLRNDAIWRGAGDGEGEGEGESVAPSLPAATLAPCYRLGVRELLDETNDTDRGIARSIRVRMAGGIDFPAARTAFWIGPKTGVAERQGLLKARSDHGRIRQDFRRLAEDEDRLRDLRARRDRARAAAGEARLLERALELAEARAALAAAEDALRAFPPGMDALRGDEVGELAAHRERAAAERAREEAAGRRRDEAKKSLHATGLTQALDDAVLRRWERGGHENEKLEAELAEVRRAIKAAETALAQVLDGLGARGGQLDPSWISDGAIRDLEEELRRLLELRGEQAGVERQVQLLGGEEEPPATEPLEHATHLLRQWQSAPAPDPGARPAPALVAGCGLLLVAGAVCGILLHPLAWIAAAVGGGLLASAYYLAWQRRREDPARRRLEQEYAGGERPQPLAWTRDDVQWLLGQIETQLQQARALHQQQERRKELLLQREDLDRRIQAAEARRGAWCQKLGLGADAADGGILELSRRLDRYRTARDAHAEVQGKRRQLEEELRVRLGHANAWLVSVGEEAVEDGSGLTAACGRLLERNREFQASSEALARARGELQDACAALDEIGERLAALFGRCGLEPDQDREVARRVERLDEWRAARDRLRREEGVRDEKRVRLAEHPDMLELEAGEARQRAESARRVAAEERELTESILGIEKELQLQRAGSRLEEAEAAVERWHRGLAEALERVLNAEAGCFLLDEIEREFQVKNLPPVLARAQAWFGAFTDQRYALRLQRGSEAELVAWDNEQEAEVGLAELSDGTRAQLLVAARLAFALDQEDGVELPFFLDEALSTADPQRFAHVAKALLELARAGRQVFYLSANPADAAAWHRACQDAGDATPVLVDLGRLRGVQAAVVDVAALVPAPFAEPPAPDGMSAAEYGVVLGVPLPDPRRPVAALPLYYLLRDRLPVLHQLLCAGLRTVGQWRALSGAGGQLVLAGEEAARLEARVELAAALREAWSIGRGRPLDRDALERSGACGSYLEAFAAIAAEHDGDARSLLDAIHERQDPRVRRYRNEKHEELATFLEEEGYYDPREPLDAESLTTAAMNAVANRLAPLEIRHLAIDLLTVFGVRHPIPPQAELDV